MNNRTNGHPEECKCMNCGGGTCNMCGCGWGFGSSGKHSLLRVGLALLVLSLVFCAGIKFGEFKSFFGRGYWNNMMYRQFPTPMMYGGNFNYKLPYSGMMEGWDSSQFPSETNQ